VILLNVPDLVNEDDVKSCLTQAGVEPRELDQNGKSSISLKTNPGGRDVWVARFDVTYPAALTLMGAGHVRIGWTQCRVKLLEKAQVTCYKCQEKDHIAAECQGQARSCQCYQCNLAGACPGPAKKLPLTASMQAADKS